MTVAMLIVPCADGIGKYLSADLSPFFLSWARYAAGSAFVVPALLLTRGSGQVTLGQMPAQLLRAVFLTAAIGFYYLAIARVPLADALGAYFVAPILATLLSALFLKEKLTARRIVAVAVGFAGALIVARPGVSMDLGMAFALGAGACMSCYIVITRAVARASPPLATLALQYLSGGLLLLLPALSHWSLPSSGSFILILLMGLVAAVSHLLVIGAFRLAEASALSPLIYFELVGTTIFGVLVSGSFPSWATWIGIGLVVAGGLILIERATEPNRIPG